MHAPSKKILVTGAFGLVGSDLTLALQKKYGADSVIAYDLKNSSTTFAGTTYTGDVRDAQKLEHIVRTHDIAVVYHLAGLLSAGGEKNPDLAWDINVQGLKTILDVAKKFSLQVFWPSSIAAFGPTTPKQQVPQNTSLEPTTIYGATKVAGELLCNYYFQRYGVDVRSLRYPGLNGYKAKPGDGTTEYAIHIFYGLFQDNAYTCYLKPDARLPMMYMDDAIAGTLSLMDAPSQNISVRTSYNFAAIDFTPSELVAQIKKLAPDFVVRYEPDSRQHIAESWPQSIDDSRARKDWGWQHAYDLEKMTQALFDGVESVVKGTRE